MKVSSKFLFLFQHKQLFAQSVSKVSLGPFKQINLELVIRTRFKSAEFSFKGYDEYQMSIKSVDFLFEAQLNTMDDMGQLVRIVPYFKILYFLGIDILNFGHWHLVLRSIGMDQFFFSRMQQSVRSIKP